jgi:hypothetical protein
VPGFIIAVGLGLTAIYDVLQSTNNYFVRKFRVDIILPGVLLFGLVLLNGLNLWVMRTHNDPRYSIYRAAGEWLRENTQPGETLGSLEVGIIGFYANRPMVDFAGLIQPDVAAQFNSNTTYQDSALWAVENYPIDYLVLQDGLFNRLEDEYVAQNCEPVERLRGAQYSYNWDLSIFDCR